MNVAEALIVGNDVEVTWSSAGPVSPARVTGTVVAINPEVVHISVSGTAPRIINVSRITEAVVRRLGVGAAARRAQAAVELRRAADALDALGGSAAAAAEHLAAALAVLPGLAAEEAT